MIFLVPAEGTNKMDEKDSTWNRTSILVKKDRNRSEL